MKILKTTSFAILFFLSTGFISFSSADQKSTTNEDNMPNIILLFADDLGYGDLSCYGHPYAKTPNLDQLAEQGTKFMKFNVTGKTCHPSRVGLLTSRVPSSYPIDTNKYGFNQAKNGYVDRITIMELMKRAGYTTGHFGKWHIGPDSEIAPGIYGLDEYEVLGGGGNDEFGRDQKIYKRAIRFIEENYEKPFYVNVMGRVTHNPVGPRPDLVDLAGYGTIDENGDLTVGSFVNRDDFTGSQIQKSFDVVESANDPANVDDAAAAGIIGDINYSMANYLTEVYFLDKFVGQLLAKLDELGIADNTIVLFSSDQGAALTAFDTNSPEKINLVGYSGGLRGQKHDEHEGGIRSPCILRWPGHVPAGKVNTKSTWSALDWLPTLCQITGVEIDLNEVHGEEVLDIWLGSDRSRVRPQYWTRAMKVIDEEGEWRIYYGLGAEPPVEELYNLSTDLQETNNLKNVRQDKAEEFQKRWVRWLNSYKNEDTTTVNQDTTTSVQDTTTSVQDTTTSVQDTTTSVQDTTTSVQDTTSTFSLQKNDVLPVFIYPNPAGNLLQIDTPLNMTAEIHIFDTAGHLLINKKFYGGYLDISALKSGVYLVQVSAENDLLHQQKILKQ